MLPWPKGLKSTESRFQLVLPLNLNFSIAIPITMGAFRKGCYGDLYGCNRLINSHPATKREFKARRIYASCLALSAVRLAE